MTSTASEHILKSPNGLCDARMLEAIRRRRLGQISFHPDFRGEGYNEFGWLSLKDEQLLRILQAAGVPIHRPACFIPKSKAPDESSLIFDGVDVDGLGDHEVNIAWAAIAVCRLSGKLRAFRIYGNPELPDVSLKNMKELAATLTKLELLLRVHGIAEHSRRWENLHEPVVPFDVFVQTVKQRVHDAQDGVNFKTVDLERARASKHHLEGSALERFIRGPLADCYWDIHRQKAGRCGAKADGSHGGPFVRFAAQFFREAEIEIADATIATALKPRTARRKLKCGPVGQK